MVLWRFGVLVDCAQRPRPITAGCTAFARFLLLALARCSTAEADHSGLHNTGRDTLEVAQISAQRPRPITAGCTGWGDHHPARPGGVLNGRGRSQRAARVVWFEDGGRRGVCSTAEADHSGLHTLRALDAAGHLGVLNGRGRSQRAAREAQVRLQRPRRVLNGRGRSQRAAPARGLDQGVALSHPVLNGRGRSQRAAHTRLSIQTSAWSLCSTAEADHSGLHRWRPLDTSPAQQCSTAEADHSGLHGLRAPAALPPGSVLNGRGRSQRAAPTVT